MRARFVPVALAVSVASAAFSATLSGRVVNDHEGAAVASADVRVFRTGIPGLTAELETDSEGRFYAEGLPDGEYRIEVSKLNHIASSVRTQLSASTPTTLRLRLIRCGAISGRVLQAGGQPVTGAVVYAMRTGAGAPRAEQTPGRFAHVDSQGRYRLFNLPPGQYLVAAAFGATTVRLGSSGDAGAVPGLGSGVQFYPSNARPQPFTITGGEAFPNIEISVLPSSLYSVSGAVSTSGPKTPGVFWLALASIEQPSVAVAATIAKEDGAFRFTGIPPGIYDLFASGPATGRGSSGASLSKEARFARTRVTVGSQDVEGLTLDASPGMSVTLRLRTPPSGCGSQAQLTLTSVEDWAAELIRQSPFTLAEPLTLAGLAPARYRVAVTGLGEACHVPQETVLDLSAGAREQLIITAVPAGAIHVTIAGEAKSAATVVLVDVTDRSQPLRVAGPDAKGQYTFGSLRPGRYRLSAKMSDAQQSRWTDETSAGVFIDVPAGEPVRVELPLP